MFLINKSNEIWVQAEKQTYDKAQLLVISGVHRLALFNATAAVGLALDIESDPTQLKDDVSLSLCV